MKIMKYMMKTMSITTFHLSLVIFSDTIEIGNIISFYFKKV